MFTSCHHNISLPDDLHLQPTMPFRSSTSSLTTSSMTKSSVNLTLSVNLTSNINLTSSQSCKNIPCAVQGRASPADLLKTVSETRLNDAKGKRTFLSQKMRSNTYSNLAVGIKGEPHKREDSSSPSGSEPKKSRHRRDTKKVKNLQKMFEYQSETDVRHKRRYKTGVKPTPSDPGPSPPPNLKKTESFGFQQNEEEEEDDEDDEDDKRLSLDSSLNNLHIKVDQDKKSRTGFHSRFGMKLARKLIPPGVDTCTLLQYAITNQDLELVEKLLQRNEVAREINCLHPPGVSVLHQACVLGNFHIVKYLVERGADVTQNTWNEWSPVRIAATFGHFDVAQLLLLTGGDVDDVRDGLKC